MVGVRVDVGDAVKRTTRQTDWAKVRKYTDRQ